MNHPQYNTLMWAFRYKNKYPKLEMFQFRVNQDQTLPKCDAVALDFELEH